MSLSLNLNSVDDSEIIFDNSIDPCPITLSIRFPDNLNPTIMSPYRSIVYQIYKKNSTCFTILLSNIESIYKLDLNNDVLYFRLSQLSNISSYSYTFSFSILNLLSLYLSNIFHLTDPSNSITLSFNISENTSLIQPFHNKLSLFLSKIDFDNPISDISDLSDSIDSEPEISNFEEDYCESEERDPVGYKVLKDYISLSSIPSPSSSLSSVPSLLNPSNEFETSQQVRENNADGNNNEIINSTDNNNEITDNIDNKVTKTNKKSLKKLLNKPKKLKFGNLKKKARSTSDLHEITDITEGNNLSLCSLNVPSLPTPIRNNPIKAFLILKIESARDLPPFRNSTRLGYDMDPFVVVSFSKQIFRTSKCRHTLNPSWNHQYINILVDDHSKNFNLIFSIYDHDYFSFNDAVCSHSVEVSKIIKELMDNNKKNNTNTWAYRKLPLNFESNSLLKRLPSSKSLKNFNPELSIKLKIVPVNELMFLPKFNPQTNKCPNCNKVDKRYKNYLQHYSICTNNLKLKSFLKPHYTTPNSATRRWYSKLLTTLAYGKLKLGTNNANILVQDRDTGLIIEEKMSPHVRLGIRLLYKSIKSDNSSDRIKRILRALSIKQGIKFDSASSKEKIISFIKFHALDLSDYLYQDINDYKTFNNFFYRKLKPNARTIEGDETIVTSAADSRLTVFENVNEAKHLWIKGRNFSISKLLGFGNNSNLDNDGNNNNNNNLNIHYSLCIFRLAPQDYHRVHCPINGKVLKVTHIHGEYYTVNPMAIRSKLDVFGENVRTIVQIKSEIFGIVEVCLIGAMMVGSVVISIEEGAHINKGDEIGYFKFGGSTVVIVFLEGSVVWDSDLMRNSKEQLETLVKFGMSIGHSPNCKEFQRGKKIDKLNDFERNKVIRRVTGFEEGREESLENWEVKELTLLEDDVDVDLKSLDLSDSISNSDGTSDSDSHIHSDSDAAGGNRTNVDAIET